ncbi:2Fe-2S iron-sulfur cluster-binding protein [Neobacillus niacini]|uniref:2Fe-2S iron-sulfur cluster-binding protein n=1 Tax=Neobacillus niacini TaxID=86668 RepID=UPI00203E7593|nr:2Fe-2S iron-sulfur cluster-binding protein [Neobacillus niacini]MCM3691672.1 2Fe-2S iron-sulfur cluster-binding protein [Neobacillus niacini]
MNNRIFTVGSLIPGRLMVKPQTLIQTERKEVKIEEIIVEQNGSKIEILPVKGMLLDAALNQGKQINYKCRKGTCGQCTVKVIKAPGLSAPNELEQKKLKNELTNGYRLACQAEII